jgi:hypothetical protein
MEWNDYDGQTSPILRKHPFNTNSPVIEPVEIPSITETPIWASQLKKNSQQLVPSRSPSPPRERSVSPKKRSSPSPTKIESPQISPKSNTLEKQTYPQLTLKCELKSEFAATLYKKQHLTPPVEVRYQIQLTREKWMHFEDGVNFFLHDTKEHEPSQQKWHVNLGVDFLGFILDVPSDLSKFAHDYNNSERSKTFTVEIQDASELNKKLWIQFKVFFVVVTNPMNKCTHATVLKVERDILSISTVPFIDEFETESICIALSTILAIMKERIFVKLQCIVDNERIRKRMVVRGGHDVMSSEYFKMYYSGNCDLDELVELPDGILKDDYVFAGKLDFYHYGIERIQNFMRAKAVMFNMQSKRARSTSPTLKEV